VRCGDAGELRAVTGAVLVEARRAGVVGDRAAVPVRPRQMFAPRSCRAVKAGKTLLAMNP
jgi:hypothetical protein